jgi:hypothetical protein
MDAKETRRDARVLLEMLLLLVTIAVALSYVGSGNAATPRPVVGPGPEISYWMSGPGRAAFRLVPRKAQTTLASTVFTTG